MASGEELEEEGSINRLQSALCTEGVSLTMLPPTPNPVRAIMAQNATKLLVPPAAMPKIPETRRVLFHEILRLRAGVSRPLYVETLGGEIRYDKKRNPVPMRSY